MNDFYSERVVKGRREYRCNFCRKPIEKGSQHTTVAMCSAGDLTTYRAHLECQSTATGQPIPQEAAAH